ncbi:MAG: lipopolysaccharide biosynthesis protein [Lachnospiraceae bacterium]|nr:lipopolysaccharide biosynthesis protein [Lachnospiraceae bacterium]
MDAKINNKTVADNILWRFLERIGAHAVTFVVSVVLARMLEPSMYGTIAIVMVFITILQVFIDGGLGNSLVQKKEADELDFSTVFFFNLILCIFLYLTLFLCAPIIAAFYGAYELVSYIRILGVTIIVSGIKNIQQAYVSKHMLFKKFFVATLIGTVGSGIVGICAAYNGYGVWALVLQYLSNVFIDTTVLWFTVKWRPRLVFSYERLKSLWNYGWKLFVSCFLDKIYLKMRSMIIGKVYSARDLAFYDRGDLFPFVIVTNIDESIDSVLLPSMASVQDEVLKVKMMTKRAIKVSTYIMAPLMMGLIACSTPLVRLLLTDKWLPCVFFLRVMSLTYMFYPIHTANLNALKAIGRTDVFLKLEIIKKIVGFIILACTMFISLKIMVLSVIIADVISQIINSWPNKRLLDYSYIEQIKDILPNIILACIMFVIVYPVSFLHMSDWVILAIQMMLGMLIYISGSLILKNDSFEYLLNIIKMYFEKN